MGLTLIAVGLLELSRWLGMSGQHMSSGALKRLGGPWGGVHTRDSVEPEILTRDPRSWLGCVCACVLCPMLCGLTD